MSQLFDPAADPEVYETLEEIDHGAFSEARVYAIPALRSLFFITSLGADALSQKPSTVASLQVYKARIRSSGRLVALKHVYLPESRQWPEYIEREVAALQTVTHPHVISLLDVQQQVR